MTILPLPAMRRRALALPIALLIPLLALLFIGAQAALAQQPPVMARLVFEGGTLTVGQPARFTLEIVHPAETVAILPDLAATWAPTIEVRSQAAPVTTVNEDGTLTTRQAIEAALFAPGNYVTPPVRAVISDRSGATINAVAAPLPLSVVSVLTEADVAPRDIKPQAGLGGIWARSGPLAGGLLLLLLAAGAGWWLWRRRHARRNRTPLERVLDELAAIDAAHYPQQGRYKEMYLAVGHAVRRHLEVEFGLPADERTTSEVRTLLRRLPLGAETTQRVLTLFTESDLVKFAQVTPTPESAAALLSEARVLSTAVTQAHAADEARRAQVQGALSAT